MRGLALALLLVGCRGAPALGQPASFRFSPRPNRAAEIHWRAWDASVFAEARARGKPVLLSLSAIWCHWCHVLDETTLSDPQVIALVNGELIAVRVDADQHPDVERRYLLGGWPTVAVLTPEGEIVAGGTYLPPAEFLAMAKDGLQAVRAGGAELERHLQRYRRQREAGQAGAVDETIVEGVARTLTGAADPVHGGFGQAPKFPEGAAVRLLLDVGELDVARRALDGMLKLEDPVEGGFFRYAMRADWSAPHYEKMLAGNAELLAAYARGFAVLHDERYRAAARRIVAYVARTLTDGSGGLYASQDADEAYYALSSRASHTPPYVDKTLLTDRAAEMIEALVEAARDLGEPALLAPARRAADVLLGLRDGDGRFFHARRPGASPELRGQLADQARAALALFALGDATREPRFTDAARAAVAATQQKSAAPEGGYFDGDAADTGLLRRRERPLVENALFARAQLAAGDRAGAKRTLAAFAGSYLFSGIEAAEYARAVEELLSTTHPAPR